MTLDDVTIPGQGSTTARRLASDALRRALRDMMALPRGAIDDAAWQAYRRVRSVLAEVATREPAALASLVRRPSVGTLIRCLRDPGRVDLDRAAVLGTLLAVILGELCEAQRLTQPISLTRFPAAWTSWLTKRRIEVPPGALALRFDGDRVQADTPQGPRDVARRTDDSAGPLFVALTEHTNLCRSDDNPLALTEAHPDKEGNAVDLGGRPLEEWTAALREAHALLGQFVPSLCADFDVTVQQVVPVGYDAQRHLSASYRENLGTIYLSLHPDPMTMAEALLHEMSHNKLNALREIDPLLEGGDAATFLSPVRPDPRPLSGVLLAVHAFVPVAELYARMQAAGHPRAATPQFARRREEIRRSNADGLATLRTHGDPTTQGRAVLDELARHITAG